MPTCGSLLLACTLALASLRGQDAFTPVNDVGLTMDGGVLPVIYGTSCGMALCITAPAGNIARGQPRNVTVYGAPNQPYLLAVSLGAPTCSFTVIGGLLIGNALMLPQPLVLAVGVTSPLVPGLPCQQGLGVQPLLLPATAPIGLQFLLQAMAASPTYPGFAFTGALQATVQ